MNDASTTRWRRIETLFHQAAEIDPTQRDAFIEGACQGDLELRAELDSLLSSTDQTLAALKGSVAAAADGLLGDQQDEWTRLGYNMAAVHTDIVSTVDRTVTAVLTDGSERVIYKDGQFQLD